jgi:hypothetical protein
MDKKAVEAARIEYQRAFQNAETIRTSNDFDTIQSAWSSFLVSSGRIYTKLEQGSKTANKSKTWWGEKLHFRRTDSLLCYLWHARNADEHTLQRIAELKETNVQNVEPTQGDIDALNRALANEKRPSVPLALLEVTWAHINMLNVIDRNVIYCAPDRHCGIKIDDTSPANIVNLALTYFDSMIEEAAQLV